MKCSQPKSSSRNVAALLVHSRQGMFSHSFNLDAFSTSRYVHEQMSIKKVIKLLNDSESGIFLFTRGYKKVSIAVKSKSAEHEKDLDKKMPYASCECVGETTIYHDDLEHFVDESFFSTATSSRALIRGIEDFFGCSVERRPDSKENCSPTAHF